MAKEGTGPKRTILDIRTAFTLVILVLTYCVLIFSMLFLFSGYSPMLYILGLVLILMLIYPFTMRNRYILYEIEGPAIRARISLPFLFQIKEADLRSAEGIFLVRKKGTIGKTLKRSDMALHIIQKGYKGYIVFDRAPEKVSTYIERYLNEEIPLVSRTRFIQMLEEKKMDRRGPPST